jgi:hypothetical protein
MTLSDNDPLRIYLQTCLYADYLALSQWQRFRLACMNIKEGIKYRVKEGRWRWGVYISVWLVLAPLGQWKKFGFDQSQESESLEIGPIVIVWMI